MHDFSPTLREDEAAVHKILSETSQRIGKCAYEMTKKGSCQGQPVCMFQHAARDSESEKKVVSKRICFKELMEKAQGVDGRRLM